MKPTRIFYGKLAALFLIVAAAFSYFSIAPKWTIGFWVVSGVAVLFIIIPIAGRPLHWTWEKFVEATGQHTRFFAALGVLTGLVAAYIFLYSDNAPLGERLANSEALWTGPHRGWAVAALVFAVIVCIPPLSRLLFSLWMKLGFMLHVVMSRVILTVVWIVAVTPIGLIARLVGKRFLVRGPDQTEASYWISREAREFDARRYKRHF